MCRTLRTLVLLGVFVLGVPRGSEVKLGEPRVVGGPEYKRKDRKSPPIDYSETENGDH